jgi:hypothetical protein
MKNIITIIILMISISAFSEERVISNRFITKNIVKSFSGEIDTREESKIVYEDSSWRYRFNKNTDEPIVQGTELDLQIPLVWYFERF